MSDPILNYGVVMKVEVTSKAKMVQRIGIMDRAKGSFFQMNI